MWMEESVYTGEAVRERGRKSGGRREGTRMTLAMRKVLSAKVCGVCCQKVSTITGEGAGLYPCV